MTSKPFLAALFVAILSTANIALAGQTDPAASTGADPASTPLQGDSASGEFVYEERCASCHLSSGSTDSGPSQEGIVGKKAASRTDYAYSDALKNSGLTWDEATLDTFLAGPSAMVPGTTMKRALTDPQDRADIIAYLKTL